MHGVCAREPDHHPLCLISTLHPVGQQRAVVNIQAMTPFRSSIAGRKLLTHDHKQNIIRAVDHRIHSVRFVTRRAWARIEFDACLTVDKKKRD